MLEFSTSENDCGCNPSPLDNFISSNCENGTTITWATLKGKPTCFIPCAHTHVPGDIIGLVNFINTTVFLNNINSTNSIALTAPSGILNATLKLSSNGGIGYKVPLSILSDGLIGQIPYAGVSSQGVLSSTDWNIFNNKFNTPTGTISDYIRGDGSIALFPSSLPPSGVAGGELTGTYPNPLVANNVISTIKIQDNAITLAKLQHGTANQVFATDGTGTPVLINASSLPVAVVGPAGGELAGTYPNPTVLNSAVLGKVLTGLSLVTGTPIAATDTIIEALGKLQKQVTDIPTLPTFTQGSVLFGGALGVITEDNSKIFWNNTFKTLIIGSNSITPTDEQLIVYNTGDSKSVVSGTHSASIILKSTLPSTRQVTLRSGTLGAQLFSSSNIPLTFYIDGVAGGVILDIDGRTTLNGGIVTNIRYINVDSLTVNVAKNENFVLINVGAIVTIPPSALNPLTIILPQTPLDGQEVSFAICNGTSGITLSSGEILVQGFGGTSIVINNLPNIAGGITYESSACSYKYSSSIGRWFRLN